MRLWSVIISLGVCLVGCSQEPVMVYDLGSKSYYQNIEASSPTPVARPQKLVNSHPDNKPHSVTVKRGDSVSAIAQKYRVPMEEIVAVNGLHAPYHLNEGQKLKLPSARFHTVQKGESLSEISQRYNTKLSVIARSNDLASPYKLHVGQVLRIPEKYTVMSSSRPPSSTKKASISKSQKSSAPMVSKPAPPITTSAGKGIFIWPVNGKIISGFGAKGSGIHNDGMNIAASRGRSVKAVADGRVAYVGEKLQGYGNLVIIKHGNDWLSAYAHLDSIKVKQGENIRRGATIGEVGSTGQVTSPQLHFALRHNREAVNPIQYLP